MFTGTDIFIQLEIVHEEFRDSLLQDVVKFPRRTVRRPHKVRIAAGEDLNS